MYFGLLDVTLNGLPYSASRTFTTGEPDEHSENLYDLECFRSGLFLLKKINSKILTNNKFCVIIQVKDLVNKYREDIKMRSNVFTSSFYYGFAFYYCKASFCCTVEK